MLLITLGFEFEYYYKKINMGLVVYDSYIKCTLLKKNGKYADQAEWKDAKSGQYLSTASFLLMTKILCVAGRRVPFDD